LEIFVLIAEGAGILAFKFVGTLPDFVTEFGYFVGKIAAGFLAAGRRNQYANANANADSYQQSGSRTPYIGVFTP
jgi:hypothetical protein